MYIYIPAEFSPSAYLLLNYRFAIAKRQFWLKKRGLRTWGFNFSIDNPLNEENVPRYAPYVKNPEASTIEIYNYIIIISMFISTALNVYLDLYLYDTICKYIYIYTTTPA